MRRLLILVFMLFCALIGISFASLNAQRVAVDYYLGIRAIPLSLVVVASLFFGAIMGAMGSIGWVMVARSEVAKLRRAGRSADHELKALRTMPIKDV